MDVPPPSWYLGEVDRTLAPWHRSPFCPNNKPTPRGQLNFLYNSIQPQNSSHPLILPMLLSSPSSPVTSQGSCAPSCTFAISGNGTMPDHSLPEDSPSSTSKFNAMEVDYRTPQLLGHQHRPRSLWQVDLALSRQGVGLHSLDQ